MLKRLSSPQDVARVVIFFWIIGWYIKGFFYFPYLLGEIIIHPVENDFFPRIFSYPLTAQFTYFLPMTLLLFLKKRESPPLRPMSVVMLVCSATLLWHRETYNDATFVTSFWVALWLVWFAWAQNKEPKIFETHAKNLAVMILSMIFMAGFVGKLTEGYLSGQMMFQIFIERNSHWPFVWLKNFLTLDQLKFLSLSVSGLIVGVEMALAFAMFLPFRIVGFWAPLLMAAVAFFSTWRILSVLSCLIGMIGACWLWGQRDGSESFTKSKLNERSDQAFF